MGLQYLDHSSELDELASTSPPAKRRRTQPTRRRVGGKNFIDLKAEDAEYIEPEPEVPSTKRQPKRKRGKIEGDTTGNTKKLKQTGAQKMDGTKASEAESPVATEHNGGKNKPSAVVEQGQTSEQKEGVRKPSTGGEKRLRQWRKKMPQSYLPRLERATSQRMFVINRTRQTSPEGVPSESVELAGSTGNVYTVTIEQQPHCTCPDGAKGNQCKHIIYVMRLVLKAPPELEYQLALVTSELKEIFERAPLPGIEAEDAQGGGKKKDEKGRKSMEGADCPICFMAFEPETEDIVWCRAACGNNVHRGCFEQWAEAQSGKEVRCVYCRTKWQGDEVSLERIKAVKAKGKLNNEGYVNVGAALGMSNVRDTSTYHQFWVRQQNRRGATWETY